MKGVSFTNTAKNGRSVGLPVGSYKRVWSILVAGGRWTWCIHKGTGQGGWKAPTQGGDIDETSYLPLQTDQPNGRLFAISEAYVGASAPARTKVEGGRAAEGEGVRARSSRNRRKRKEIAHWSVGASATNYADLCPHCPLSQSARGAPARPEKKRRRGAVSSLHRRDTGWERCREAANDNDQILLDAPGDETKSEPVWVHGGIHVLEPEGGKQDGR